MINFQTINPGIGLAFTETLLVALLFFFMYRDLKHGLIQFF